MDTLAGKIYQGMIGESGESLLYLTQIITHFIHRVRGYLDRLQKIKKNESDGECDGQLF
jgi:hypothetical protein